MNHLLEVVQYMTDSRQIHLLSLKEKIESIWRRPTLHAILRERYTHFPRDGIEHEKACLNRSKDALFQSPHHFGGHGLLRSIGKGDVFSDVGLACFVSCQLFAQEKQCAALFP